VRPAALADGAATHWIAACGGSAVLIVLIHEAGKSLRVWLQGRVALRGSEHRDTVVIRYGPNQEIYIERTALAPASKFEAESSVVPLSKVGPTATGDAVSMPSGEVARRRPSTRGPAGRANGPPREQMAESDAAPHEGQPSSP